MLAAPMVGTDISVLHVALEKVVRDKKQVRSSSRDDGLRAARGVWSPGARAVWPGTRSPRLDVSLLMPRLLLPPKALEELHRVRNYVRDRLATVPFLQTSPTRKAKKKAGSQFKGNAGRLRALEQVSTSSRTAGRPEGSIMTGMPSLECRLAHRVDGCGREGGWVYAGVTSRTAKTKATSRPENIVVPEQYAKVIETLKERQEKVWQVQAMNELGDVHAHFGNWAEATQIWNDALDTIVGPYQVGTEAL